MMLLVQKLVIHFPKLLDLVLNILMIKQMMPVLLWANRFIKLNKCYQKDYLMNGLFGKNSCLRCFVAKFIADGFTRFLCYFFGQKVR